MRRERSNRGTLRWAFGVSCALIACKGDPPPSPPVAPRPTARRPPTVMQAPPRPIGRGAQVVVDVSQSIAGFTALRRESRRGRVRWESSGSTRLSSLHHQVIDRSLAELQANVPFRRCTLDAALHCEGSPVPPENFDRLETYRGSDAALDAVLRRPASGARSDTAPVDPLDPFAITVLLTDGFQTGAGGGGQVDANCAGGADPSCLGTLLRARVLEGYGVWLGHIMMPFAGTYFPERSMRELWSGVERHVEDLNMNRPEWTGVVFRAQRSDRDTPSGAFRWEGARPLLMFVLSRSPTLGRSFVDRLRAHLPTETTLFVRGSGSDMHFSELAPFEGASARIQEAAIRRASGGPESTAVRIATARRGADGVHVDIRCPLTGVAQFPVPTTFTRGVLIPGYVDVVPSWRVASGAGAWLRPTTRPGSLDLDVTVDCRRLPQGTHRQTLGVFVEWRRNEARLASEWFIRESVETSYEAPERVYRLREIALPPVTAATSRQGWLEHLHVSVTRE